VLTVVRILRSSKLADAYADAWAHWDQSDEADAWDRTVSDGLV
jgi:hypothetical protein